LSSEEPNLICKPEGTPIILPIQIKRKALSSFPQGEGERALWLSRHAAFLIASGLDPDKAANARVAIDTQTNVLTPEQDEAILREAGFSNVSLFYAAFSFRGWVAYA
jgi:tRNA (cmo5U34)-methyltransferase